MIVRTVFAFAGLAFSARVAVAVLRVRGQAAVALATIVVAAALLVLSTIVLSLLHAFDVAGALTSTTLMSLLAAGAWLRLGRPRLLWGRVPDRRALLAAARSQPVVAVVLVAAVGALLVEAVLGLTVASNEQDALLYHLPRAAYWVQYHTALQFRPGTLGDPEIGNPPNAELMIAWTMLLTHGDALVNLVQWMFAWVLALSVYLGARLVGFTRAAAWFAGGITALLPQPIMQASTAQNDLVEAALVAAGSVFLLRGLRGRHPGALAVSAAAIGLAAGTKGSIVYALPGLGLLSVGAVLAWRPPRRLIAAAAGMFLAAGVALAAFNYMQNIQNTGDLTGGMTQEVAGDYVKSGPLRDVARVGWNLLDLPGFGDPRWLHAAAGAVARPLFGHFEGPYYSAPRSITTDVSEDESAYGPVGWLVLVPLTVGCLVLPRAPWSMRLCAAAACSYLVFLALDLGYGPEEGRLLMPAIAFAAPLLGLIARWRVPAALTALAATLAAVATIAYDQNKPLLRDDSPSVLTLSRLQQQLVDGGFGEKLPAIKRLDQLLPGRARLAFLEQDDTIDYVLFGPRLDRYVIPLGDDEVTVGQLKRTRARGIFVWNASEWRHCSSCSRGTGLRAISLGAGALLLVPGAKHPGREPTRGRATARARTAQGAA